MERKDLRSRIIPTTIDNTDEFQKTENEEFNTTDLIYLDSYDEQFNDNKTDKERTVSSTDYAKMNHIIINNGQTTRTGKQTVNVLLRTAYSKSQVGFIR